MSRSSSSVFEQFIVVALVQADRWFIQNVQHPDQARADLGGESYALCLSAGEGRRRPAEGQIIQADITQEAEPLARSL